MHHAAPPPRTASWLAYAGLLPFVLGALLAWLIGRADDLAPPAFVVDALSRYGAVIVSFTSGATVTGTGARPCCSRRRARPVSGAP